MRITMSELLALNSSNIIDIRSSKQFKLKHIPNTQNIPAMNLLANPEKYLNKEETYYILCQTGMTSDKICQILNQKGYKLINVIGGYQAYEI